MHNPWLQHYPPGVPAAARIDAYRSLTELLEAAFQRHASRDALACMDSRMSFRDVDEMSQSLGAWLQSLGMERGARVAVMMPNLPQYLVAIAAILRAGYVVVNVNPLYTARELEHQLTDSGAEAVIVLENFAHTLEECIDRTPCAMSCWRRWATCSVSGAAGSSISPCAMFAAWCPNSSCRWTAGARSRRSATP